MSLHCIFFKKLLSKSSSILTANVLSCLLVCSSITLTMFTPVNAIADTYPIPEDGSRVIGTALEYKIKKGDYFHTISKYFNIGFIALMEANPDVDPFLPVPGTILQIPSQMILPDVPYEGIVVNLPELRMYYFSKSSNEVHVFPIGIGLAERPTPVMNSSIRMKLKNPSWSPNARMRAEYLEENGTELPAIVPSGDDNPLGYYALQLDYGRNDYLIHGTNANFGIGLRVSSGCIRMNNDDIEWLFARVNKKDKVSIINQPIKVAVEPNGENFIEVHAPLSNVEDEISYEFSWLKELFKLNEQDEIGDDEITNALLRQQGLPISLTRSTFE